MKKIIILFSFILSLQIHAGGPIPSSLKHKKKTEIKGKSDSKKEVREYNKVFPKQEKLSIGHSNDLSLYLYDNKLYMELPIKNIGREFLVSSTISASSSVNLSGRRTNRLSCLIVDKADTLITFSKPRQNYVVNEEDTSHVQAFGLSRRNAVYKTFPIKAWSKDSTKVLFECSDYFKSSNKDIFNLEGMSYEPGLSIASFNAKDGNDFFESVQAFRKCVCVNKSLSGELVLSMLGYAISDKPEIQVSLQIMISQLPTGEDMMRTREANGSVGTGYVSYHDYRDITNVKKGYHVTKRKYSKGDKIIFYADTLISDTWYHAVLDASERWNDAFESQSLGRPIIVQRYPKTADFSENNPMENIIVLANNTQQNFLISNITDPRTGEIISSRISVPRNLADDVRRNGIAKMAEVDSRYRTYFLPDDLLCEILKARMLKAFGRSLGLIRNLAGSAAYSPAQLRSPEFTRRHGITASVMDGMIYNYLAMPGDREKGVVLTFNKPGICDEFVLKYLYTPLGADEDSVLKSWVKQHAGDARYRYGKPSVFYAPDPRSQSFDMGNDPIQASRALLRHFKYTAKNAETWFAADTIPSKFTIFFPEYMVLDIVNSINILTQYVGGVYNNEYVSGTQLPINVPVSKPLQKKVVRELFNAYDDISWLEADPKFFQMNGISNGIDRWGQTSGLLFTSVMSRLSKMDISVSHAKHPYTQRDFMDDLEDYIFESVKAGKKVTNKDVIKMWRYVETIIGKSPVMAAIAASKKGNQSSSLTIQTDDIIDIRSMTVEQLQGVVPILMLAKSVQAVEPVRELSYFSPKDIEPLLYDKLKSAKKLLDRAKRLTVTKRDVEKINFILLSVDRILK